jgi:hypothetical protein
MNETNYGHHGNEGPEHHRALPGLPGPYWQRAHRDWRVWVAVLFCLAAITIYVMSDDLAFLPRHQLSQSGGRRR